MKALFIGSVGVLLGFMMMVTVRAETVTLNLQSGSSLKGEVVSKSETEVVFETEFGTMRLKPAQLTRETRVMLGIEQVPAAYYEKKIAELEELVAKLRLENAALRKSLAQAKAAKTNAPSKFAPSGSPPRTTPKAVSKTHWLTSSSGIRHNSRCRYYGNSKGRACTASEGRGCKICGG